MLRIHQCKRFHKIGQTLRGPRVRATCALLALLFGAVWLSGCGSRKPCVDDLGCPAGERCGDDGFCTTAAPHCDACGPLEYCAGSACAARFSALRIEAPSVVDGPFVVSVVADLAAGAPADSSIEPTDITRTLSGGNALRPLERRGPRRFDWPIEPLDVGVMTVTASLKGLDAQASVSVDFEAPTVTISVTPYAPAPYSPDGLTTRPEAWRAGDLLTGSISFTDDGAAPAALSVQAGGQLVHVTDAGVAGTEYPFSVVISDTGFTGVEGTIDVVGAAVDSAGHRAESDRRSLPVSRLYWQRTPRLPSVGGVPTLPLAVAGTGDVIVGEDTGAVTRLRRDGLRLDATVVSQTAVMLAVSALPDAGAPQVHMLTTALVDGGFALEGASYPLDNLDAGIFWASGVVGTQLFGFSLLAEGDGHTVLGCSRGQAQGCALWSVALGERPPRVTASALETRTFPTASGSTALAGVDDGVGLITRKDGGLSLDTLPTPEFIGAQQVIATRDGSLAAFTAGTTPALVWLTASSKRHHVALPESGSTLLVGDDGFWVALGAKSSLGSQLCHVEPDTQALRCTQRFPTETVVSAFLGAGNQVVLATQGPAASMIRAFDRLSLTPLWELTTPVLSFPMTLVCAPDDRSGLLIGYSQSGQVVALSVPAPGPDATASWPMPGHDPGMSSNIATDLRPWACPGRP